MKTTGDRIFELRKQKGYSREALAKLCGISSKSIQNYENNSRVPVIDNIKKIAEALGTSVDYLVKGVETDLSTEELTQEEMEEIKERTSALFAGGKLSEEAKLNFLQELQNIYIDARRREIEDNK